MRIPVNEGVLLEDLNSGFRQVGEINGLFRGMYHKFDRSDLNNVMFEGQFPVTKNK